MSGDEGLGLLSLLGWQAVKIDTVRTRVMREKKFFHKLNTWLVIKRKSMLQQLLNLWSRNFAFCEEVIPDSNDKKS